MFIKYFLELRNRGSLVLLTWSVTLTVSYFNKQILLFLLVNPILELFENKPLYFIATNLTDTFSTYICLSYFIAFQFTILSFVYHIKNFVTPALYLMETKKLNLAYNAILSFWGIGFFILNKITLPICYYFFLTFQEESQSSIKIFIELHISEYLVFYTQIYYITIGMALFFLSVFLGIHNLRKKVLFVQKTRKFFYVMLYMLATFVTPPDILSQFVLGSSFILFYEILIVIIMLIRFKLIRQPIKAS